jgi:hypothetical protein
VARLQAEHSGEQRRRDRSRDDEPTQVERMTLERVEPRRFVCGVRSGGEQPAGDDHQHDGGDPEEPVEIDADAAAIQARAEDHRGENAQQRTEARRQLVVGRLERGQQEHRRFQALS